jgi:CheY-like chemotaxis protein
MECHDHASPSVLTALVVDDSYAARARITTLLHLGGWRVHQAVGTEDALRVAALVEPDLVVTDMVMRQGHGATLMRRLREQGSTARFLVMAARRTHQTRALAASAGALACLAKPVVEVGPHTEQLFLSSLPQRLAAIATSAQEGDATTVAMGAAALASAADRLGHAEVAFVSHAIARDARRGTVTRERLITLVELCARLDPSALAA